MKKYLRKMVKEVKSEIKNEKKPFYKKWWGILLIIFGVIIIFGIFTDNNSSEKSNNTRLVNELACTPNWSCEGWSECSSDGKQVRTCSDMNNCETDKNKPSLTQSCQYSYKIGDIIRAGDFSWKVTNIEKSSQIGEMLFGTLMGVEADGIFLIFSVEVTNEGKSAKYLMDSFLKLLDSKGREFSPDSVAAIYLKNNQAMMFDQVNPGITKKGKIVFDVPKDIDSLNLKISSNLVSDSFSSLKFAI